MHAITSNPDEIKSGKAPGGHRLRHSSGASGMVLVPVMSHPMPQADICPTCQVIHPVRTIHLNLEMGTVIVSAGVLSLMLEAGTLAELGFTYDQAVMNPPPLKLGGGKTRAQVDQENRAIRIYGALKKGK